MREVAGGSPAGAFSSPHVCPDTVAAPPTAATAELKRFFETAAPAARRSAELAPLLQGKKARRPFERANSTTGFRGLWKCPETARKGAPRGGLAKVASIEPRSALEGREGHFGAGLRVVVRNGQKLAKTCQEKNMEIGIFCSARNQLYPTK
jgi:hypothetical protein